MKLIHNIITPYSGIHTMSCSCLNLCRVRDEICVGVWRGVAPLCVVILRAYTLHISMSLLWLNLNGYGFCASLLCHCADCHTTPASKYNKIIFALLEEHNAKEYLHRHCSSELRYGKQANINSINVEHKN